MPKLDLPKADAIVVGSGPNGLAAAIRLAQAGWTVVVVESAATPGGGVRSAEVTLPGFVHDICSSVFPMAACSPYLRELPLEDHGLDWVFPPAALAHPFDDGSAVLLYPSLQKTMANLGEDGPAYKRLIGAPLPHWQDLMGDVFAPIHPPRHPFLMARFGLNALRPARSLARSVFKTERGRALFAGLAAHSLLPLEQPSSSAVALVLGLAAHAAGWPFARGGSQHLTNALVSYLKSLGGQVITGCTVESLDQLPPARAVLLDITPRQFLNITRDYVLSSGQEHESGIAGSVESDEKRAAGSRDDEEGAGPAQGYNDRDAGSEGGYDDAAAVSAPGYDDRVRGTTHGYENRPAPSGSVAESGRRHATTPSPSAWAFYRRKLERYRYGVGSFKIDWALSRPVPWRAPECRIAGTLHLGGTLDEICESERHAWEAAAKGQQGSAAWTSDRPFVLFAQPTVFDPSRAPASQHTAWGYCHVPNGYTGDMTAGIENQVERFAPGFRNSILARSVMGPIALERHNPNLVGGDIAGGAMVLSQLFLRPTTSLYRTPLSGVYLCSSSTPPGPGVHGMCGYFAAEAALKHSQR